jgi:riboflavin kinase / FMN adenylyltransferase
MEFVRGLHNIRARHRGCVATIGNFDGVHLGHRRVVSQLLEASRRFKLPATVVLFEPQPTEFFFGASAPPRLSRWRDKIETLCNFGVQRVVCLRFDEILAQQQAADFVGQFLVGQLGVRHLVIGDDFRFGHGRDGNFQLLQTLGIAHGYTVAQADTLSIEGERVSSTRIRELLCLAKFPQAQRFLGRPFSVSGHVVHGAQQGRAIGFPTANINLGRTRSPVRGIFAARVGGLRKEPIEAVAYIGNRPIINGKTDLLEVHMLDYADNCYGRLLRVQLLAKLRDDKHFLNFDELKVQIAKDVSRAKELLNTDLGGLAQEAV